MRLLANFKDGVAHAEHIDRQDDSTHARERRATGLHRGRKTGVVVVVLRFLDFPGVAVSRKDGRVVRFRIQRAE